jgi:hypothetical protein
MADLSGNGGSMKPTSVVAVLVFLVACFLGSVRAQTHDKKDEIPIKRYNCLPVVTKKVAGGKPAVPARYSSRHDPQSEVFHIG